MAPSSVGITLSAQDKQEARIQKIQQDRVAVRIP